MALGNGTGALFGFRQESSFMTAATVDATGYGFRPISFDWQDNWPDLPDKSINGKVMERESTLLGNYSGTIKIVQDIKYTDTIRMIGLAWGTCGAPATVNTSYYGHTATVAASMTSKSATFAFYDGVYYHQLLGCRCVGGEVKGTMGSECLQLTTEWTIGKRQTGTSPNTALSTMTEITTIKRVQPLASNCVYKIINQGGTLATIEIKEWMFKWSRPFPYSYSSSTAPYTRETQPGGFTASGSIEFPQLETAFLTYANASITPGTNYALVLDHQLTASVETLGLTLPSVKFLGPPNTSVKDRGEIPLKCDFICNEAVTSTTGAAISAFPYWYVINSDSRTMVA